MSSRNNKKNSSTPDELEIVDSDLGPIGYKATGKGKPVLLTHGAGSSHEFWNNQVNWLDCRAVSITLPGHASLPRRDVPTSVEDYTDCVSLIVDELSLDAPTVVGHSMGGAITQNFALEHNVEKIVLIGTGPRLPVNEDLLENCREDPKSAMDFVLKWSFSPDVDEQVKEEARRVMKSVTGDTLYQDFKACDEFDLTDEIAQIEVPVLIMEGTRDKMTPSNLSQELVETLPNSSHVKVKGSGHMIPLERPSEVSSILNDWILEK